MDRIEYAETDYDDGSHEPYMVRGLALSGSALTLRELVEELHDMNVVPPAIAAKHPKLTLEDFQGALFAIQCILYSLEGCSSDARGQLRYTTAYPDL